LPALGILFASVVRSGFIPFNRLHFWDDTANEQDKTSNLAPWSSTTWVSRFPNHEFPTSLTHDFTYISIVSMALSLCLCLSIRSAYWKERRFGALTGILIVGIGVAIVIVVFDSIGV
jgi:hypothetical protein